MLSVKDRAIFIHIPKTGGSSVEQMFCGEGSQNVPHRHRTLSQIVEDSKIDPTEYFKFSILRNTFDRILSTYFHRLRVTGDDSLTFRAYLSHIKNYMYQQDVYIEKGTKRFHRNVEGFVFDIRQINRLDYWFDESEIDCFLRFEKLEKDWQEIKDKFNKGNLVHINQNPHKKRSYGDYYDSEIESTVYEIYHEEIDRYGYKLESRLTAMLKRWWI